MINSDHNPGKVDKTITQCPLHSVNQIYAPLSITSTKHPSISAKINYLGMKYLGKWWILQYFGSVYPGVLAHFSDKGLLNRLFYGQQKSFTEAIVQEKKTVYNYFLTSGIDDFAKKNGNICTFRLGHTPAIYQNSNVPIVKDEYLDPPTDQNTKIFGEFLATLPLHSKARRMKRVLVESILGNLSAISKLEDEFKTNIANILKKYEKIEINLDRFCKEVSADAGTLASGIFDFKVKPLSYYFDEFNEITLTFFELAWSSVSRTNKEADKKFSTICQFVKSILIDNYSAIYDAPDSNIIKRYFHYWKLPLTLKSIEKLSNESLRELGTIIISIYDTTSLTLTWAISYIENNPSIKQLIMNEASAPSHNSKCSYIDLVAVEAVRLGGGNPTVLSRTVLKQFQLQIGANKIIVQPGTRLWLNRRQANQDSNIFDNPTQFDPNNIKSIVCSEHDNIAALVSKNRYEINSFNAINTIDNPRKCPARVYSIYVQSLILSTIYGHYQITLKNNNLKMNPDCPMPRPLAYGTILLQQKTPQN